MIFFLASLPVATYNTLQDIFKMYEDEYLTKSKNKKGQAVKPDCKGSNFRGLRNLEEDMVDELLKQVHNQSLPIQKLNTRCHEIKRIRELKKKFVDLVGLSTWEEAQAQFPEFATEDKIKEKFISLSKDIQPLVEYCQKAMRYVGISINDEITYHTCRFKEASQVPESIDTDGVYLKGPSGTFACFVNALTESLSYSVFKKMMPNFPGFPLSVIEISEEDSINQVLCIDKLLCCNALFVLHHILYVYFLV